MFHPKTISCQGHASGASFSSSLGPLFLVPHSGRWGLEHGLSIIPVEIQSQRARGDVKAALMFILMLISSFLSLSLPPFSPSCLHSNAKRSPSSDQVPLLKLRLWAKQIKNRIATLLIHWRVSFFLFQEPPSTRRSHLSLHWLTLPLMRENN